MLKTSWSPQSEDMCWTKRSFFQNVLWKLQWSGREQTLWVNFVFLRAQLHTPVLCPERHHWSGRRQADRPLMFSSKSSPAWACPWLLSGLIIAGFLLSVPHSVFFLLLQESTFPLENCSNENIFARIKNQYPSKTEGATELPSPASLWEKTTLLCPVSSATYFFKCVTDCDKWQML